MGGIPCAVRDGLLLGETAQVRKRLDLEVNEKYNNRQQHVSCGQVAPNLQSVY